MDEAEAANQSGGSREDPNAKSEPGRRFRRRSARRRRLLASIKAYKLERIVLQNGAAGASAPWHAAEELLSQAEDAVKMWWADLDRGYALFLAAQRTDILCFDGSRVRAAARSLLEEANGGKIKGWRKAAIVGLVKDLAYDAALAKTKDDQGKATQEQESQETSSAERSGADDGRTRLQEATLLRDEASQNTYRKLDTLKRHLLVLSSVLSLTLAGLFPMAILFPLTARFTMPFTWQALVYVLLFGLLGACTSALLSVIRKETQADIPAQLSQGVVVFARPLFGATAALALYLFVQSGLFTTGPVRIDAQSTTAVLGLSFIAGFTERLVVSVVETTVPKAPDTTLAGGRDGGL
jgi:hypothetical protein